MINDNHENHDNHDNQLLSYKLIIPSDYSYISYKS